MKIKENEKRDKYLDLARELKKVWNMIVMVISVVIHMLGTVPKGLEEGWKSWKLKDESISFKLQH